MSKRKSVLWVAMRDGWRALIFVLSFLALSYPFCLAQTNGCGPQSLGFLSDFLPNGPFPLSNDLFLPACDAHDICYQLGGEATQASCDQTFLTTMLAACTEHFPDPADLSYCTRTAHLFYSLVDQYGENSVAIHFTPDPGSVAVAGLGELELNTLNILPGFTGQDLHICVTAKNTGKINTHFHLYLYAAKDRTDTDLPDDDLQLAWFPTFSYETLFLRAGSSQEICLGTDGFMGIARTLAQFEGQYRLELWVESRRFDLGLKRVDVLEGFIDSIK
ncbi:MAG: hypothetical protein KC422_09070 [Trueperaceae bacterium]|nr:hypothetical protein [Trueperaceae bacterium]